MTTRPAALEIIIPLTRRMLIKHDNSPFNTMKVFSFWAHGIARAQRRASTHPWHLAKQMDHT
jgi:hypothetical protein